MSNLGEIFEEYSGDYLIFVGDYVIYKSEPPKDEFGFITKYYLGIVIDENEKAIEVKDDQILVHFFSWEIDDVVDIENVIPLSHSEGWGLKLNGRLVSG